MNLATGRWPSIAFAVLLTAGGLLASGCTTSGNYRASPIEPQNLPDYTLELQTRGEPEYDEDRYDVSLGFELRARDEFAYNAIVQEIVQEVVYKRYDGREFRESLVLVEAFKLHRVGMDAEGLVVYRLPSFQRDRHYERGYLSVGPMIERIDVWRVVRFYPAFVEGADWTNLGFAHLPGNRVGTMVTDIPENFNESHQRNYAMTGSIVQDDRARGQFYNMRYEWWREPSAQRPQAKFTFTSSGRPTDEPAWLAQTINHGVLDGKAGE